MYSIEEIKNAKSTDEFEFICEHCGKKFTRTKKEISKNKYKLPKFCSKECIKKHFEVNSYLHVKCAQCGADLTIQKSVYNKSKTKHFFCNHSCSAKYNNTSKVEYKNILWIGDKKKKGYNQCPICGKLKYYTSELCNDCANAKKKTIKERTLGSYIEGKKYSSVCCNYIRKDARKTIENSNIEKVCAYCHNHEFDDILEVHHIKGICQFDKNAKISEINDEKNLVWLCPNHHKMIEMGLINLKRT